MRRASHRASIDDDADDRADDGADGVSWQQSRVMAVLCAWLDRDDNRAASFSTMLDHLRQCSLDPPCRTTLSKWLEGHIFTQNLSCPDTALDAFRLQCSLPDASPTELLRRAVIHARATIDGADSAIFIGELECCIWTKQHKGVSARSAVVVTAFVAVSLTDGLVHSTCLAGRSQDAAVGPFLLDVRRMMQRQHGSADMVVVVDGSRAREAASVASRVVSTAAGAGTVNVAGVALEQCREHIRTLDSQVTAARSHKPLPAETLTHSLTLLLSAELANLQQSLPFKR
jgi:hypothetical protein